MRRWVSAAMMAVMCAGGAAVAQEGFVMEDQTPTGKFLTATEVRPILEATQGNWIAVRDYNGQDLLYFTHLLAWRCGLHAVRFAINDGPMQPFELPPCDAEAPAPAAIPDGAVIYLGFPSGSIETVTVELFYDDLGTSSARFERAAVQIP